MFANLSSSKQSKTKLLSKILMAFVFILSAGSTLHSYQAEARSNKASAKGKKKPAGKKKRYLKIRNLSTPAGVFALYQNSLFGYGKCLPRLEESPHKILTRNGIDTARASDKERAALAAGIAQVERLLGKPIPSEYRYDYQWVEASGPWNSGISRAGYVTVKRPKGSAKGLLTGRMMHELGHRFGHANGGENYNEYKRHMRGKKCRITTYCGKSLNEEFAEVFEAYVVNPDFLAKHCPDSYAYFKNKLFRNSEALLASCEDPNSVLDHEDNQEEDDSDAVEDTQEPQIDEEKDFALPLRGPVPYIRPGNVAISLPQSSHSEAPVVQQSDEQYVPPSTATPIPRPASN